MMHLELKSPPFPTPMSVLFQVHMCFWVWGVNPLEHSRSGLSSLSSYIHIRRFVELHTQSELWKRCLRCMFSQ